MSWIEILGFVESKIKELFEIDENKECRLLHKTCGSYETLGNKNELLKDSSIYNAPLLVLEFKNSDGTWPRVKSG